MNTPARSLAPAKVLLFSLVATGQIVMRKIVGHADLGRVLLMSKAKAA